jgi:hypothetical protein
MLDFFDYFEYKNAPSIPGPKVDLETYQGLSTSDMQSFVKYKPYDKWYRLMNTSILEFKTAFEESCKTPMDAVVFLQMYITFKVIEDIE